MKVAIVKNYLAMPKLLNSFYKCKYNLTEEKYSKYQYQHGTESNKI